MLIETQEAKQETLNLIFVHMTNTMQEFRGSMIRILLGFSGFAVVLLGWIVTKADLSLRQKILFTVGTVAIMFFAAYVTRMMKNYFNSIAQVINRINRLQRVFEDGAYLPDTTLFPKGENGWDLFGTPQWKEPVFHASYVGIVVIGILALTAIWLG